MERKVVRLRLRDSNWNYFKKVNAGRIMIVEKDC